MKILVMSSHTPSLFWFRMDMMKTFIDRGAEVVALGPEDENRWSGQFGDAGIKYRQIPVSRNGLNVFADIRTYRALKRIIREEHPDKIFTYQAKTIVYGSLAARSAGGIEVYALVAGLGSIFRGSGLKARIIRCILSLQYRLAFRCSKCVIFQNNDDRDELTARHLLRSDKTRMIHGSGVNTEHFSVAPQPERPAVLFIGRLIGDKGIHEYLEVCTRLKRSRPELRCLVVGPFDSNPSAISSDELQEYIDKGIVEYFGEQKDVRPYIAQCTVFVLPSYHEGTPKTVLEAMAMGRPIVTSDAPGCRETVVNGVNGYLVPVKNVDALEQAIVSIIDDPRRAEAFGAKSREMAESIFDVRKVNHDILKIMEL